MGGPSTGITTAEGDQALVAPKMKEQNNQHVVLCKFCVRPWEDNFSCGSTLPACGCSPLVPAGDRAYKNVTTQLRLQKRKKNTHDCLCDVTDNNLFPPSDVENKILIDNNKLSCLFFDLYFSHSQLKIYIHPKPNVNINDWRNNEFLPPPPANVKKLWTKMPV